MPSVTSCFTVTHLHCDHRLYYQHERHFSNMCVPVIASLLVRGSSNEIHWISFIKTHQMNYSHRRLESESNVLAMGLYSERV